MLNGSCQEFLQCNALGADQQLALHRKRAGKGSHARKCGLAAAALDFNGGDGAARNQNEVDLAAAVEPIIDIDSGAGSAVQEMRTDGRFDQATPSIAVPVNTCESGVGKRSHERGVEHLEFGAGTALANYLSGVLGQTGEKAGAPEQVEVVRESDRVAGVLQLAKHLLVREYLPGVLLIDPCAIPEGGLVGRGVMNRDRQLLGDLPREGGLADLAWPGEDLQEPAGLPHPLQEGREQTAFELRLHRGSYGLLRIVR